MTRAIAYLRRSTDKQGTTIETQRAAIQAWAEAEGAEIAAWHEEAPLSGGTPIEDRPALGEALGDVVAMKADALVVHKRDRLARDIATAGAIEYMIRGAGASIVAADGNGNGEGDAALVVRTLENLFADMERRKIRHRTREAMQAKMARGEAAGGIAPFGFRREGDLWVEDEAEQASIRRVLALRKRGKGVRAIARQMEAEGATARSSWHPSTVAGILKRAGRG